MADNTTLNSGTGGDTIASDDIGGVKHQRVKLSVGADGSASDAVPVSAGMDVTGAAVQAVGLVAQYDDTTPSSVTENQFAPVRMSSRRALLVEGVASGTAVTVDGSGVTQPVSAASLPLPTGAASAANQSTIIGHVDGIEGLLTTIDADTSALAGAVAGTEIQVDVVAALPAGTNNIGDVDVLSVVPGTGATNLGKAEDAAHTTGDVGVMALSVRQDTAAALGGTDGDYQPLVTDASGRLHVSVGNTVTVTATNLDVQSGGADLATSTQAAAIQAAVETIDNAIAGSEMQVDIVSGSVGVTGTVTVDSELPTAAALADDAANPTAPAVGAFGMVWDGATWDRAPGTSADGALVNLGANNDVTVTGTVTANLAAGDNNIGNVDIVTVPAPLSTTGNGTAATALRVTLASDSTGVVAVTDNAGSLTVDNGGTFAVQAAQSGTWNVTNVSGTVSLPTGAATSANQSTAITALQLIDNAIVAHDAAISGATGVNVAGFNARSTAPTAVGDGDATQGLATLLGKLVTYPYALPGSSWSYAAASGGITDTTGVTAKAAAGAGVRNYVTSAQVVNGHATVSTDVQIRDGASGTVLHRGFAQAAGGGYAVRFDPPLRGTANTLIEVACGTTGSATYVSLQGFTAAE